MVDLTLLQLSTPLTLTLTRNQSQFSRYSEVSQSHQQHLFQHASAGVGLHFAFLKLTISHRVNLHGVSNGVVLELLLKYVVAVWPFLIIL